MGQVKQLLPYRGRTLVEHVIQEAQGADLRPIVVVLGANADLVRDAVARTPGHPAVNQNWQQGMGSSITCGLRRMLELTPEIQAIAMLLADQPYITARHLAAMKHAFDESNNCILAASYAGTLGVPAIFPRCEFEKLENLPPNAGARVLLRSRESVKGYELPEAVTDVDTPEDFAVLR